MTLASDFCIFNAMGKGAILRALARLLQTGAKVAVRATPRVLPKTVRAVRPVAKAAVRAWRPASNVVRRAGVRAVARPNIRSIKSTVTRTSRLISRPPTTALGRNATRITKLATKQPATRTVAPKLTSRIAKSIVNTPRRVGKWAWRNKGMLAFTAATIGIPMGIDASMQQKAELKADRMHHENLQIIKQQQQQQQQQQFHPDALGGYIGGGGGGGSDGRLETFCDP
jgi:hypothetical protein